MWPETLDLLRTAGRRTPLGLRVASGSMRPLLRPGDTVEVMSLEPGELVCGDVVAVLNGEEIIVHRFLGHRRLLDGGASLLLRGDAAVSADEPQPAAALLGRVVSVERRGGGRLDLGRHHWRFLNRLAGGLSFLLAVASWGARRVRGQPSPRPGVPTR